MTTYTHTQDRHDEDTISRLVVDRVVDRITELLEPSTTREHQWLPSDDGERLEPHAHVVEHPPLIVQLATADRGSTAGVSGGGFESRPVGNLEALSTLATIHREASIWVRAITRRPAPFELGRLLRLLVDRTPLLSRDQLHNLDHDVLRWWSRARVTTTWDTAPIKPFVQCSACERRGGLQVRPDPLTAVCLYCGEAWDASTIGALGNHVRLMLEPPIDQPSAAADSDDQAVSA